MKYLSTFIIVLLSLQLNAQNVQILQNEIKYKKTNYPALTIAIEPDTKDTKKYLKDFIKDKYDVKMKGIGFLTNKDVLYAEEVKLSVIDTKKLDFYAKVIEKDDHTLVSFFGNFGYDILISPQNNPVAYNNMRGLMVAFLDDYLPGYYTDQVEKAKDEVADLKEKTEDLNDDISDNKSDIEEKLEEIEKLKKENKKLSKELTETKDKLYENENKLKTTEFELNKITKSLKTLKENN